VATDSDQPGQLKPYCNNVGVAEEAGCTLYLLEGLRFPGGCIPASTDVLLCPDPRDGYPTRMYFKQQIQSPYARNWNMSTVILGATWHAFSWRVEYDGKSLVRLLLGHLEAFTR
jgi:hypothetical protein